MAIADYKIYKSENVKAVIVLSLKPGQFLFCCQISLNQYKK